MPVIREYPPAVIVHRPDCQDLQGRQLPRLTTPEIARQHPNGKPHRCYHFHQNSVGVVEQVEYPPHSYEESSVMYADATKPLCGFCGSTHGVLDVLILPVNARGASPNTA